ncbi:tRNA dimethylallyltransferase [Peptostreptococcaceae bacterium AS15]|nr:tRNA dimethylallyltransferase [Peptostreptococcaceae bacterium AS15]
MKQIVIICGPTAVGKTAVSIKLAQKLDTEIISSDSMQIYKGMDIGTAKIRKDEMQGIKHHMIDIVEPCNEYSVSDYANDSLKIIGDLFSKKKIPLIVGGTGLYINSLIYKMDFNSSKKNCEIRSKYRNVFEEKGVDFLYDILVSKNSKIASTIEKNNVKRVIRALEILDNSDEIRAFEDVKVFQNYKVNMYVLKMDREILYNNINNRVDAMISDGLIEEVEKLMKKGLTSEHQSMKAIGYRQILSYLEGDISKEDAIELIKRDSRRYAKRQYTWFKRYDFSKWIDAENRDVDRIVDMLYDDIIVNNID